jgi:hypothetical protein
MGDARRSRIPPSLLNLSERCGMRTRIELPLTLWFLMDILCETVLID